MKKELLYKNKYGISTARLWDWDYSDAGMYFVTICTVNRERHFGNITNGIVVLNECGR
ncbi:hypothetical protein KAR34_07925 [bacterium]|nr:hypothetical protein [bacterium]